VNGIHDMGGMHGMGPIDPERNEPVFHEAWESRVLAISFSLRPWAQGRNWGNNRYRLETIPPAEYLRMSYYERWFSSLTSRLLGSDLVTQEELDNGAADPGQPTPPQLPASPQESVGSGRLDLQVEPRFRPNQAVRARNINPVGHTRLPRYTRGRRGTIVSDHGVFALQDTDVNGQRLGPFPQHVYTVQFTARELWGNDALAPDAVYVDLWEDYLEPA
jgi:nitrile hydratase beta subunit